MPIYEVQVSIATALDRVIVRADSEEEARKIVEKYDGFVDLERYSDIQDDLCKDKRVLDVIEDDGLDYVCRSTISIEECDNDDYYEDL